MNHNFHLFAIDFFFIRLILKRLERKRKRKRKINLNNEEKNVKS